MSLTAPLPEDDLPVLIGRPTERTQLHRSRTHDDAQRQRLHAPVCGPSKELLRSFVAARGLSQAALVDALIHALATADVAWLEAVIGRARTIDAQRRRRYRRA